MSRRALPFIAVDPDGVRTEELNLSKFAAERGLDYNACNQALRGRRQHYKGWKFYPVEEEKPAPRQQQQTREGEQPPMTPAEKRAELRRALDELGARTRRIARGDEPIPPGGWHPERFLAAYKMEADAYGLDLKHIQDGRSPEEKMADAVDSLLATPSDLFALEDEQVEILLARMEEVQGKGLQYFTERCERLRKEGKAAPDPKVMKETATEWVARLRKIKRLRTLAKQPVDPTIPESKTFERRVSEATRLLRYMLYVGRSDIDDDNNGGIFTIGRHAIKMAVDLWEGINRIEWTEWGPYRAGEVVGSLVGMTGPTSNGVPYDGVMQMYPPRHTKTTLLRFLCGQLIGENPRIQGAYIHDRDEEASDFLKHVAVLFNPDTESGRRHLSLYPAALAKYDNNAGTIRVKSKDPPKNPNLKACSIMSSALGNNLDFLLADDVVPQSDQTQPTERMRRKSIFRGTWLTRLQGINHFYVISGYPWHHDDLVWECYGLAKKAAESGGLIGLRLRVSRMPVGGPNTSPPFFSIWPEQYPPHILRKRYRSIADPAIWSANYELNPITDSMRIVKKVRMWDPELDPEEEARFLATAEYHLSVDPSANARQKSDYTGLVLVAFGDLVRATYGEKGEEYVHRETIIRIVAVEEFHATQSDLSDRIAAIAAGRRIDRVHVEAVTGFKAVREMLYNMHGISSVTEHTTGSKSKEIRLRAVAGMIEDGSPGLRAKVMFPGTTVGRGVSATDEGVKKLIDYVVNFKAASGHHTLDALTQVLAYLAPFCGVGEGAVSSEVAKAKNPAGSPRVRKMLEHLKARSKPRGPSGMMSFTGGQGV